MLHLLHVHYRTITKIDDGQEHIYYIVVNIQASKTKSRNTQMSDVQNSNTCTLQSPEMNTRCAHFGRVPKGDTMAHLSYYNCECPYEWVAISAGGLWGVINPLSTTYLYIGTLLNHSWIWCPFGNHFGVPHCVLLIQGFTSNETALIVFFTAPNHGSVETYIDCCWYCCRFYSTHKYNIFYIISTDLLLWTFGIC